MTRVRRWRGSSRNRFWKLFEVLESSSSWAFLFCRVLGSFLDCSAVKINKINVTVNDTFLLVSQFVAYLFRLVEPFRSVLDVLACQVKIIGNAIGTGNR